MVQFIPRAKSTSERFFDALGMASEGAVKGLMSQQESQQRQEAFKELGLDPSIASLPKEAQAAYFKEHFKQESPLQKTQRELNEAKLESLKDRKNIFNELFPTTKETGMEKTVPPSMEQDIPELNPEQRTALERMSDEQLRKASAFKNEPGEEGIIGNLAQGELDRREKKEKINRQTFESERAYHSGYTKETEKKVNDLRTSLPRKEMALNFARNATETGDVSYFSGDKLADATGIDLFRTTKGAQLLTAGKENLLNNMGRVSARAQNIWFEQRLNSMFPKIGQSREANLTTQEMLEGEASIDRAYINEYDRLSDEDEKKYGFVKKDIDKRVANNLKPAEKEILQRTTYRMKEIEEQEKGLSSLKKQVGKDVIKGTPLTMAMARLYKERFGENALKVAEKNGYYIPTLEEFKLFQSRPEEFREQL